MAEEPKTPETPEHDPLSPELTPAQQQHVGKWIAEHWGGAGCPFHGPTRWQVGPFIAAVPPHYQKGGPRPDQVYPGVALVCTKCGFTVFLNTNVMGLTPLGGKSPEPEAEAE